MTQLDKTRALLVMNICESHQLGVSCDSEDAEGSRGVSGGPAQGGDVGGTMETQCPMEAGYGTVATVKHPYKSRLPYRDV